MEDIKIDPVVAWKPENDGLEGSDMGSFPGSSQQLSSSILSMLDDRVIAEWRELQYLICEEIKA